MAAVTVALLALVLRLWKTTLALPWSYVGDTNFHTMLVQTSLERGWYLATPRLGAPLGQHMHDFPLGGETLQLLIMKGLGLVLRNPFAVINAYYVLTFVLVALSAYVVLRLLGITRLTSGPFAVLYAFLPYHFTAHGQAHLFLSGYFGVPLAVLLLYWHLDGSLLGSGTRTPDPAPGSLRRRWVTVAALSAVTGSLSTYYAVFTLTLLLFAIAVEVARSRSWRPVVPAALVGGVVCVTLVLGLLPTLLYQHSHGDNPEVARRSAHHTEILGLRVTALLVPREDHRLAPLAELGARSRQVPFPSEPGQSLGIVGAIGFMLLVGTGLGHILRPFPPTSPLRRRLATLTLLAVLVGTVSGLSFLFALLGLEEVRAWNRLVVFIAFFSLAGLASHLDELVARWRRSGSSLARPALAAGMAGMLVLGVLDQTSNRDVPDYNRIRNEFESDRSFVAGIEARLAPGAMVFQFPYVPFPESGPIAGAFDYDLLIGYLQSRHLRWSYGAMRAREEDWQNQWVNHPMDSVVAGLSAVGFTGIYVDRLAYVDRAAALEQDLTRILHGRPSASRNGRLAFFDLRRFGDRFRVQHTPGEVSALRQAVLHPPLLRWVEGFSSEERDQRDRWRWANSEARLELANSRSSIRPVTLRFRAQPASPTHVVLRVMGTGADTRVEIPPEGREVSVPLLLPRGPETLTFTTEFASPKVAQPVNDPRLRVVNLHVVDPVVDRILGGSGG